MTLDHTRLAPEDVRAVVREGVPLNGIQDALEVAFLFNVYDRLADTMGWHVPAEASTFYAGAAKRLLSNGYR